MGNTLKILVERPLAMGDVLLAIPALRGLKEKFPNSHLTFLTSCPEAVIGCDYIDDLTTDPQVRDNGNFDLRYYLTYEDEPKLHIIDNYCKKAGVTPVSKEVTISLTEDDRKFADEFLRSHQITSETLLIAVHSGLTWPCRMWIPENYHKVLNHFIQKYQAKVVELSREKDAYFGIGINLTGCTTLKQTAAILTKCKIALCVDSMIMHLVGAVRTPLVSLFGCTDPDKRLPFNDVSVGIQSGGSCVGCHHKNPPPRCYSECTKDNIKCMEEITPERVILEMEMLLQRTQRINLWITVHLENIGDRIFWNDIFAGTRSLLRRLEGFQINIAPPVPGLTLEYMAHLQDIGDTEWVGEGTFVGTRGEFRRLEGFAIRTAGPLAEDYNIYYMAHLSGSGDTDVFSNGQFCGTRGQFRSVEAIYVWIRHK